MEANVAQVIFVLSFVSKPVVVVLFHKWRHLLQVGCIFFFFFTAGPFLFLTTLL